MEPSVTLLSKFNKPLFYNIPVLSEVYEDNRFGDGS